MADDSRTTDVGARYAQALFDLAVERGELDSIEADLKILESLLADSADLRRLLSSPKFTAEDKSRGLHAVAWRFMLGSTTRKFLGLLAANRRAAVLGEVIRGFRARAADRRGEISAQVTVAAPLTDAQAAGLAAALRTAFGREPTIDLRVDPRILGGLKVRVGSRLFDASLKSKLDSLKYALKRA